MNLLSSPATKAVALAQQLKGQLILAPLTRGGNYPFRRLCQDFGMTVSFSEMVYARHLVDGDMVERARLRRPPSSQQSSIFGVQIATNDAAEGAAAMHIARESGANFVDLNCGCPIHEAVRRGLGSALLRVPSTLGALVRDMAQLAPEIPLTVKIRLGGDTPDHALEIVRALYEGGAAAVAVHGRTARQRYTQSADWDWIQRIVHDMKHTNMPIIGNGDILTQYEAQRRLNDNGGVHAVMVGRGALVKPWIFQEFRDSCEWEPTAPDRIAVYRRLACYMKEYFGKDEFGRKRAWAFLPWHFDFFSRYRPLPEAEFGLKSLERPLIHERVVSPDNLLPLEALLCSRHADAHELIARELWESVSDADAVSRLTVLAESQELCAVYERGGSSDDIESNTELSNIPATTTSKTYKKQRRIPKPKRTPEEIEAVRAERALKRAAMGVTASSHVEGRL